MFGDILHYHFLLISQKHYKNRISTPSKSSYSVNSTGKAVISSLPALQWAISSQAFLSGCSRIPTCMGKSSLSCLKYICLWLRRMDRQHKLHRGKRKRKTTFIWDESDIMSKFVIYLYFGFWYIGMEQWTPKSGFGSDRSNVFISIT